MADFRISQLPDIGADTAADDVLPITDSSAGETKKVQASKLVAAGIDGLPSGSIDLDKIDVDDGTLDAKALKQNSVTGGPTGQIALSTITADNMAPGSVVDAAIFSVNGSKLVNGTVSDDKLGTDIDGAKLKDGTVPATKLSGTIEGSQITPGTVADAQLASGIDGAKLLADSVVSGSIVSLAGGKLDNGTVTNEKLAAGIDGSKVLDGSIPSAKLISPVDGGMLAAGSITNEKLAAGIDGVKLLDATVGDAKITGLDGVKILPGTVNDAQLAVGIDGAKLKTASVAPSALAPGINGTLLLNGSVPATALAGGILGSQLAALTITSDKIQSVNGASLLEGTVAANKLDESTLNRSIDLDDDGKLGIANEIVPGTSAGLTYNAQGIITAAAPISPDEIPLATSITVGGVSVPADGGLSVTGTGELSIDATTTPATVSGITINKFGQVTNLVPLVGADLPIASNVALGGVRIPVGGKLSIGLSGDLFHNDAPVGAGPHIKFTTDASGHIASTLPLDQTDIPDLDASKIISGTLDPGLVGDESIASKHLADYATCLMQEDFPGFSPDFYLGMMWWQPSTSQLRVYSRGSAGNQWSPVGFGALQANNLRWGGTFDAANSTISIVTEFGKSAGLEPGDAVPAPTDDLSGIYFICQADGNAVPHEDVTSVNFTAGDWLLCINEVQGYTHIDMGASGGGGGGASVLNDLLDVTIGNSGSGITLQDEHLLKYDKSDGIWRNMNEIDGGTF
jgi:hypothetical protein